MDEKCLENISKKLPTLCVFKCVYKNCDVIAESRGIIEKHLELYNHEVYLDDQVVEKCPFINCYEIGNVKKHISKVHLNENSNVDANIVELYKVKFIKKDDQNDVKKVKIKKSSIEKKVKIIKLENLLLHKIFDNFFFWIFPKGMICCMEEECYKCHIPGCKGAVFENEDGYINHMKNKEHKLRDILHLYEFIKKLPDFNSIKNFKSKFGIKKLFKIQGICHNHFYKNPVVVDVLFTTANKLKDKKNEKIKRGTESMFWRRKKRNILPESEYLEMYTKLEEKITFPIKNIVFEGRSAQISNINKFEGFTVYNLNQCITSAGFWKEYIFIAVKCGFNYENSFKFNIGETKIHVYNKSWELISVYTESIGYCRKMLISPNEEEKAVIIGLFDDGTLRKIIFDEEFKFIKDFKINSNLVDFDVNWNENSIIATDGITIFKIINDSLSVMYRDKKPSPLIVSIAFDDFTGFNNAIDNTYKIMCLNSTGEVCVYNSDLTEGKILTNKMGFTKLLPLAGEMILTASILEKCTAMLTFDHKKNKYCGQTRIIRDFLASTLSIQKKIFVMGSFSGSASYGFVNKKLKTVNPRTFDIISLKLSKDSAIVGYHDEEITALSKCNTEPLALPMERVVNIIIDDSDLYIFYHCGLVIHIVNEN